MGSDYQSQKYTVMIDNLGPADRFAAGAVGEPGYRVFYLQVEVEDSIRSFLVEKQQVELLGSRSLQILSRGEIRVDGAEVERIITQGLSIYEPDEEDFRVGSIAVSFTDEDLFEILLEDTEGEEQVTFSVIPAQMAAMALVGLKVVSAGRPICRWCRLPISDPEYHHCSAWN